ncbi:MAG: acyl-CoA dehydrogenase family protein [Actinomycetota bacterium]
MSTTFFTPEHEALRLSLRSFAESELAPYAQEWEEAHHFPDSVFTRMGEAGFLGLCYPPQYGGQGRDYLCSIVLAEELARCESGSVALAVEAHTDMATPPINKFGTEEQKLEYLAPAIRGEKIACLGITEPGAGSDVQRISTYARRDGSDWVITGRKTFITNGVRAHFCTLLAKTDGGFNVFLVDKGLPGFAVARALDKVGIRASDTAELVLDEVRVPSTKVLGEEGKGFYHIMWELQGERLAGSAGMVAGARFLLEKTIRYAREKTASGVPLIKRQAIAHRLADLAARIEAARQLVYWAAWLVSQGQYPVKEISMTKLSTARLSFEMADTCLQVFGAGGYSMELPIERAWRDSRMGRIGGGTDEIMRDVIGRMEGS